jgi:CheY-like chemotaxis protein
MPEKPDANAVCCRLCKTWHRRLHPNLKVIAMSESGEMSDRLATAANLAAHAVIGKPFWSKEFIALVSTTLGSKRA